MLQYFLYSREGQHVCNVLEFDHQLFIVQFVDICIALNKSSLDDRAYDSGVGIALHEIDVVVSIKRGRRP